MARTLAFFLAASLAFADAALAQCPPNYVGPNLTSPSGTPIVAAEHSDSSCANSPSCDWRSQWNHSLGTAHCEVQGPPCPTEIVNVLDVGQYTSDDFVLTGPTGPDAVEFRVLLHVIGSATNGCHTYCDPFTGCHTTCTPGSISASLGDGSQTSASGPAATLGTDLQLTLHRAVGEHFHLDRSLYAHAFCGSFSSLSSQLEIVLPPGYGVTSCYGYTASGPVPALRASWGKVKTLYR